MEDYLKTTLELLKTDYYAELNLVIGNESCDLDSAVSSVVYAAFLYWQYDIIKCCKVCTRFNRDEVAYKDKIFVPVLNVDRQDYPLKTEVVYCFKEAGINEDLLIFRDDYDFKELAAKTKTTVTIVDHHVLAKADEFYTPYVTEIIDHRPMDKSQWSYKDDTRTTIHTVGSCCTLVAQRIKDLSTLVAKEADFFNQYKMCTDMLYSTIILDTVNFSKEVDKATTEDIEITEYLENVLKPTDIAMERKAKLDRLVSVRRDVSTLTVAQLLRKDVKLIDSVLVPSFPVTVKEFLSRPGAAEAVSEALASRECSAAVLLGMSLVDGLSRDAAICGDNTIVQTLSEFLVSWKPSLDLSPDKLPNKSDDKLEVRYYTQGNLSASRKQYMPALKQFLK